MTTITVAAWLPVEPEPQVQPTASATLHDLRAAATAISDVASWARAEGQPPGWLGRSAESANQAVARFTHDVEAVDVALQKATLAVDRFLSAMADLRTSYAELMRRRIVLSAKRPPGQTRGGPDQADGKVRRRSVCLARSDRERRGYVHSSACVGRHRGRGFMRYSGHPNRHRDAGC